MAIARSALSPGGEATASGIIAPKQSGFSVANTTFVNFDQPGSFAISGCSQCKFRQGGFPAQVKELTFENSPNKVINFHIL